MAPVSVSWALPWSWLETRLRDYKMWSPWASALARPPHDPCPPYLLPPSLSFHLAPEPSNLAGKDKHKPCFPTPVELKTKRWFPGPGAGFQDGGEGGVVGGRMMCSARIEALGVRDWSIRLFGSSGSVFPLVHLQLQPGRGGLWLFHTPY